MLLHNTQYRDVKMLIFNTESNNEFFFKFFKGSTYLIWPFMELKKKVKTTWTLTEHQTFISLTMGRSVKEHC